MRYLALDVSEKRIGIAMTDPLGWTVQPVETLDRKRLEQDLDTISTYVQDFSIKCVVVGLPLRGADGEVGEQAKKALMFCDQLGAYCRGQGLGAEIVTWDESLTTKEAEEMLREAGVKRKKRAEAVDQLAAVLILQSYLASLKEQR